MARRQALGRGLKALIPETPRARSGLAEIPVDRIRPNPHQPRHHFDEEALQELAASVARHGLLQPLVVSEDPDGDGYVLVAGERRLRAARKAGLATVPAVIRERVDGAGELELALVENLQRRDLTPLEEARAFEDLRSRFGLSQAEIASRVGRDRSSVANSLRLLRLPAEIQVLVEEGRLSSSAARTILGFPDTETQVLWARRAAEGAVNVRDLEREAARAQKTPRRTRNRRPAADPNLEAAAQRLALKLGARVEIRPARRGGAIRIVCREDAELIRVFDMLMGEDHHGPKH